nr:hypothetical protein [Halorientalis sp.]
MPEPVVQEDGEGDPRGGRGQQDNSPSVHPVGSPGSRDGGEPRDGDNGEPGLPDRPRCLTQQRERRGLVQPEHLAGRGERRVHKRRLPPRDAVERHEGPEAAEQFAGVRCAGGGGDGPPSEHRVILDWLGYITGHVGADKENPKAPSDACVISAKQPDRGESRRLFGTVLPSG